MDAKDHPVISVLGDQRRFIVPIYQRQYTWKDQRLGPFWDDVAAKAEEVLEGKPKSSHYMGALILSPGGDGFTIGTTPRVQVVDGQQRLTTFQLFLAALREVGERVGVADIGETIRNYLFVRPMSGDIDADARFKLVPTPEDRAMDLVRNNIFHRAAGQGESAEALFEAKWRPFDALFWKTDAPRAKPRRPRIDHFLSHALTAQTGEETSCANSMQSTAPSLVQKADQDSPP